MHLLADAASVETGAAVATAVGTILTVVTALWLQWGRERLREPRLSLSLGRQATGVTLGEDVAGVTNRIRLRVTASAKRRTAHQVEVLISAAWPVPSLPGKEYLVLDHEPLSWYGSHRDQGAVTQISLAPGISREVSLAWIGRPLDLYETIGMSRPTNQDVQLADAGAPNAPPITSAFGAFDVPLREEYPSRFLETHLSYKVRLDVTARDIDTVSYETEIRVQPIWQKPGQASEQDVPTTHAARNKQAVQINVSWSPLRRVRTSTPFAPMDWRITIKNADLPLGYPIASEDGQDRNASAMTETTERNFPMIASDKDATSPGEDAAHLRGNISEAAIRRAAEAGDPMLRTTSGYYSPPGTRRSWLRPAPGGKWLLKPGILVARSTSGCCSQTRWTRRSWPGPAPG